MRNFFALLFGFGLGGFVLWYFGQGILADYSLRSADLTPAPEIAMTDGSCRSRLFIVSTCDLTFATPGSETEFHYLVLSDMGGRSVELLRSAEGAFTTDIGLGMIWNRVGSMAAIAGILFLIGLGGLRGLLSRS